MFESRFQTFAALGDPSHGAARVAELRAELAKAGLAGFLVPRADEHQNEYVPAGAERLRWLTGFAGSAGIAVVLKRAAALFVDGRYTEQVKSEADASVFEFREVPGDPPAEWIARHLKAGDKLGYDPRLHTPEAVARYAAACEKAGAALVAVDSNPIDAIWPDRPPAPLGAITTHKLRFAGESASAKSARVRQAIKPSQGLLISDPHNLAWLFNIRGADVSYTPLPLGWAYLPREGRPVVFLDRRKLTSSGGNSLSRQADVLEPGALLAFVEDLGRKGGRVAFDAATVPAFLTQAIERAGGKADIGADPITLMKAKKNPAELAGARAAHERDGAGITNFLAWFTAEAPKGRLTEIDAVKALETFRRASPALRDLSFPTISAFGPNSAIPHYRVSEASNRRIGRGIFLVDSGAQYEDGTTDITRTIAVGRPSALQRDRFTRVLKGHIAVARAVFPAGTNGAQIDALARATLWRAGLDFDHGTGHGIGSYLSVHEGPQRLAKTGTTALAPGMIVSDEPGYYAAGAFGIRIENLLAVEARTIPGGERPMLGFETLTLAPIDLSLVEPALMDAEEVAWLDAYHARVRKVLAPRVDASTRRWLAKATRRLASAKRAS
ncbi:MAG TPA: aminopeptidase P family protein [Roseiarcus sp.]|nr:aminopeptidase P family protein [Roseiarcus sp.]